MRRIFALFVLFLTFLILAACDSRSQIGEWEGQIKLPVAKQHPAVLEAAQQWQIEYAAATATAASATATATMLPSTETPEPSPAPFVHQIQEGETLTAISIRYDCSVEEIGRQNGIEDVNLVYQNQLLQLAPPCRK